MALYDVVLARGRVLDPETGLDAVRDVGLNGGTIAAISEADLSAAAASSHSADFLSRLSTDRFCIRFLYGFDRCAVFRWTSCRGL
eukprot:COSAG02_NODE_2682_length_8253_cov_3.591857_7_plen_85_part_00